MERLQKVIAQSGYCSRRKAEELIAAGKVTVNGEVITEMGVKVKNDDFILVEGNPLNTENKVYYMMYKPKNMICTVKDEHGRSCVLDLFKDVPERIYPIGRLDYDSTGLLFLTNDGEFANLLMHPSSHLPKIYDISIKGILDEADKERLEKGVYLEGTKTLPCEIYVNHRDEEHNITRLKIRLVEGKNRQIRKMFDEVGYEVVRLHREAIGTVYLHGMVPGETRRLKPHEVKELRTLAMAKKQENIGFVKEINHYRPKAKKVETPKKKPYVSKFKNEENKDGSKRFDSNKPAGKFSRNGQTRKTEGTSQERRTSGNGRGRKPGNSNQRRNPNGNQFHRS